MVVWRCPHCATPQAETARCWVCHRSTTSCATCQHFRPSVANGLGVCGLDPRRVALTGTEIRVCWTAPKPLTDEPPERRPAVVRGGAVPATARAPRTFVPVEDVRTTREPELAMPAAVGDPAVKAPPAPTGRWSLWDEPGS